MSTPTFRDLDRELEQLQRRAADLSMRDLRYCDPLAAELSERARKARELLIDLEEAERLRNG